VPAANTAFKLTMDILRKEGLLPAPQPLSADARVATHHTFSQPQLKVAVQGATASGTPIVMSHALGLDLRMWDELATQLADGHAVLRYDHRGHGGSAVPAGPYTMDDLVDDAARLIREWGRGPVVWVGLSMGGMVGQGLAIRYPELVKAVEGLNLDDALGVVGVERKSSSLSHFLPALGLITISAAIGAGIALLLAPSSGRRLRARLADGIDDAKHRLTDSIGRSEATARNERHTVS